MSTKLYSVSNIKKIVEENGLKELYDYLLDAPESVKKIIFSWSDLDSVNEFKKYEMELFHHNRKKQYYDENPYKEIDFDKKIIINELITYINDSNVCLKHNIELKNKQIVIEYNKEKGSKYNVLLPTCKECKRIFIQSGKIEFMEERLRERNIIFFVLNDDNYKD